MKKTYRIHAGAIACAMLAAFPALAADVPHYVPSPSAPPSIGEDGGIIVSDITRAGINVPREDEFGLANLALNPKAKAAASSVFMDGRMRIHQTAHLNDGLAGNEHSWISQGEPCWAEIDLGDVYWIYKTAFASDDSRRFSDRAAVTFSIQTTTRENWETVFTQEDGAPVHARKEFAFEPVQARRVRICIEKGLSSPVRIDEIEIYGQKEPIPANRISPTKPEEQQQPKQIVEESSWSEEEMLQYAFLGEEHAWLKTYGRADLAGYLVPYNGRVEEYPRHAGDDCLPLPEITSAPQLDGSLDDPCWAEASRGVVRVAYPYHFDESPCVEHRIWAGRYDDNLCLAIHTDRLLSGNAAVLSSGNWSGCGVVAYSSEGLVFRTYEMDGALKESISLQSGFDSSLGCIEITIPLSTFPGWRETGIRIGAGMGGRHTRREGRAITFLPSSLSVAETAPEPGGAFSVRLSASSRGSSAEIETNLPNSDETIRLNPGESRIVDIPATMGAIGPEFQLEINEQGKSYALHLFQYAPLHRTLTLMEELAKRLQAKGYNVDRELGELEDLRQLHHQLASNPATTIGDERQAFYKARLAKRRLFFRERDLEKMDSLLFVKRHAYEPSHIYTDYTDAPFRPGGAVCTISIPRDSAGRFEPGRASVTRLYESHDGIARDPVTDFDRKKIYFGYRPSEEGYYHILAMNADGSGLEQITDGPFHDFYPCCLSDGDLAFISTRCTARVFCFRGGASVLFRMNKEGEDIKALSLASLSEWAPSLMNDGRIIWTRWEYVDKGADFTQTLWAIRPDGSHPELVFGNTIIQPNGYASGREVPGTNEICCTLVSHFGDINGPIALVDIDKGRFNPNAIESITPEVPWPGMWPREECFRDPIPLARDYFLCSHAPRKTFGIYVIDRYGNREAVHIDPNISSMYPTFFRPMPRPPVLQDHPDRKVENGVFVMADVYDGLEPAVPRGAVKYIRVVEEVRHHIKMLPNGEYRKDHAEFLEWYAAPVDLVNGPYGWPSYVAKAPLGIVPVDEDGSAHFTAPAGKNLYFQALDKDFNELQRMRSMVQLQPGETRGCIGCHEERTAAPPAHGPTAMRRAPDPIQPAEWGGVPLFYEKVVQPVLDAKCAGCHNAQHKSGLDFTATLDSNSIPASYRTMITKGLVNFVDCGWNSGGCEKRDPLTFSSLQSKLWKVLDAGHHGVELSVDDMRRIKTWTDMNCPLWGGLCQTLRSRVT